MNKLKKLTLLTICCVVGGLAVASAQSVMSQQQIQQKMDHNKGYDQQKLDALKSQTNAGQKEDEMKLASIQQVEVIEQENKNLLDKQQQLGGYLPIPGFSPTGNPIVDGPAYTAAKTAYMQKDPYGYRQLTSITTK